MGAVVCKKIHRIYETRSIKILKNWPAMNAQNRLLLKRSQNE